MIARLLVQDWTPGRPGPELTRRPVADQVGAWTRWIRLQGYTVAETDAILGPMGRAVAVRVAEVEAQRQAEDPPEGLDPEARQGVIAGTVMAYLIQRPPELLGELDARPPLYLSAVALGLRLVDHGPAPELGARLLVDLVTGARWWGRAFQDPDQAGTTVVAAQLYQLLGVAAPRVRLAVIEGTTLAVHAAPVAWDPLDPEAVERWGAELAAQLPADAWIGNTGGPAAMRARQVEIPDTAGTLRLDLAACLSFRGPGRRDRTWTMDDLAQLGDALTAPPGSRVGKVYQVAREHPERLAPLVKRIAALTETEISAAVGAGGLGDRARAGLVATLIGRRELVAAEFRRVIAGATPGA